MRRPQKAQGPTPRRVGKHVLIVEADPESQVELAYALRQSGHCVVAASSVAGALALTLHFDVDLALVSQELPRTTGVDVSYALSAARPALPILVVANEGSPGLRVAARRAGARDCIPRDDLQTSLDRFLYEDEAVLAAAGDDFEPSLEVTAQSAE